ncbi:MAG TPA: translocation/assembly module TamB domain-containing protein, partial [Labilithrix sp.]|nr:translocation/assembly module TamB domain-containing protein [Labilithrix sp.]
TVRVKATDIDVQALAVMTGVSQLRVLPEGSRATLDVDVRSGADRADGHFDVTIAGAKDGSAAELHGTVAGRHVSARGRVAAASLGWVEVTRAEIDLPGAPSVSALARATGAMDLRGEVDLSQGAALFAGERIERISGRAFLSARLERGDPRNLPTVYASASTRDLDLTLNDQGKSTHIAGIDGAIHVGHDGATEETETSLLTWDKAGIIASADAKARVPLVAWLSGRTKVDRDALGALAVNGVVAVPSRDVSQLPADLARPDLRGTLSARAELGGSIAHPIVTLVARAQDLAQQKPDTGPGGPSYQPIDGVVNARWDGRHVVATVSLDEEPRPPRKDGAPRKVERAPGHARGLVLARLPVTDLFAGRPLAWNASAELDVTTLELAPLPLPLNIRGALTGHVKVRDLAGSPELDASSYIDNLTVGGAKATRGEVVVHAKNGSLDAVARISQEDGGNGLVHVVSRALQWHATEIAWDGAQPTRIDYAVDRMRLGILRPLVRRMIPEIDGRVDGTGSATVDAQSQVFEGGLTLSEGRFYVNAIGEEISEVGAVARFERNGVFRIKDATGRVGAGVVTASASGKMNGLSLETAEATLVIPSKEGVPLSAEGATFAQATGEVNVKVTVAPDTKALLVTVAVPRSKVTLPDRGTQNLQSLDPDESIAIGVRQQDGSLVAPALRPGAARSQARKAAAGQQKKQDLLARFTVTLGNDVELEGRGLRLQLDGRTVVDLAEEVAVTGQIQLRQGGTIDVQGRKFVVDRGTVTFLEGANPSDPLVVAAAYWDAPDRTRVWVEFNGPLKTGKLTLRSEPAYSKSEILSVLLFGRADPNQATQGERPSDSQQAAALGTGIASSGLNKALGELDEDFDLEQDRTSANRVRTKVGYRLRRNLKVQLGYASGFSQREPDTTYLFLEWQFIPKWSLIGTRGDRGTSILDVLFQHRY